MYKVAVFVGSLRRGSMNMKLARALAHMGQSKFRFQFVEIRDLPLYNDDLWDQVPPSVHRLKSDILNADAVLFVTPEYNRSITPALKNAIDWGTRPRGQNSWAGKPGSIVGASPGNIGTAAAQAHLRSIATILEIHLLGQPEVYVSAKPELFDDEGHIRDQSTSEFLIGWLDQFEKWVARFVQSPARG